MTPLNSTSFALVERGHGPALQPALPGIERAVAEALPRLPVRAVEIAPILCRHKTRLLCREQLRPGRYLLAIGRRVPGEVVVGPAQNQPIEGLDTPHWWGHELSAAKSYDDEVFVR